MQPNTKISTNQPVGAGMGTHHPAFSLKIALVRHGETDWNKTDKIQGHSDIPLNETGILQAQKAAEWLAGNGPWDVLYSSELIRARTTAEIIGTSLRLGLTIRELLAERKFGALEGLTAAEREERFPLRMQDETTVPGLEIRRDFRERVVTTFEAILAETTGTNIVIVSHGGWINQLLFHLSGGAIGSGITKLKNGCIYILGNQEKDHSWDIQEIVLD
jgi:broad specificity phosphatase PhoE